MSHFSSATAAVLRKVPITEGAPVISGETFTASSNKSGAAVSGQTIGALTISNSPTSCTIVGGSGFFAVSNSGIITVTTGGATSIVPTGTGATYNVVVNASNGSGTSSNVTIPVIFYPDGALDAPTGTPQYPTLFDTYEQRPPWQVAGVDYYVGLPSGTSLRDPTSGGLPSGASYSSSTHQITLSTVGTTFQGWDMSVGNGVGLIVNAANCVVKNNKFIMGSNNRVPILIETNGNSCYIGYNLIDEGGHMDTETFGGVIYVVFAANTFAPTIEYNEIRNGASDMIDIGKGLTLNRFNLMTQDGEAGGHPDFQQTNPFSGATGTQQMYFNTWINTYGIAGSNGQGASIGDNSCPVSGACSFNNNVLLANGPGNPSDDEVSISYWIIVDRGSLQSGATVSVQNNWADISSAYGFAYPGSSGSGVTFANNTDLISGFVTPSAGVTGTTYPSPGGAVVIAADANIQAVVNAHSAGTAFLLSTGTYSGQTVSPSAGSSFYGQTGAIMDGGGTVTQAFSGQGVANVTISGITFQNYAPPTNGIGVLGLDSSASGWTVQACTFTSMSAGPAVMLGANMTMKDCSVFNNQLGGIGGFDVTGGVIRNNNIYANNQSMSAIFTPTGDAAGIKIATCTNVEIANNNIYSNLVCPGIWTDIGCVGTVIEDNIISGNGGPGIIDEIDYGVTISGNLIETNNTPALDGFEGGGIYIQNAQNAVVSNNYLSSNIGGVWLFQSSRGSGRDGSYVVNNDVISNNIIRMTSGNHGYDSSVSSGEFAFNSNAYHLSDAAELVVAGSDVTPSQWQTDGNDVGGSFN